MRPRLYLFGDSITEEAYSSDCGWGAGLSNEMSRLADVYLRGYDGYNTRWILEVIETIFPPEINISPGRVPSVVTICFGAEDASSPDGCSSFQHVPLDEYKNNLRSIINYFKKHWPEVRIYLITPPPVDEAARLRHLKNTPSAGILDRTSKAAAEYAEKCISIGEELVIPVVNLWQVLEGPHKKKYLRDGLHLSPRGNDVLYDEVFKKLIEIGFTLRGLEMELPDACEVDPNDPLKIFREYRESLNL